MQTNKQTNKRTYSVPLTVNKLTSPVTLSSYDFRLFALCDTTDEVGSSSSLYTKVHPKSQWEHSMSTLHGDMYYTTSTTNSSSSSSSSSTIQMPKGFHIPMLQETYCQHSCFLNTETTSTGNKNNNNNEKNRWEYAIENNLHYHWSVDQLPAVYKYEDE